MSFNKLRNIYCCGCKATMICELVRGDKVYPSRKDLKSLFFWKCGKCNNFVGTHKNSSRHIPLGVIPTKELKNARRHIHQILDPLYISGKYKRKEIYDTISDHVGYRYHTAQTKCIDECRKIYRFIKNNFYKNFITMLRVLYDEINENETKDDITLYNLKQSDINFNKETFICSSLGWMKNDSNRTFQDLETYLRNNDFNTHLLAKPHKYTEDIELENLNSNPSAVSSAQDQWNSIKFNANKESIKDEELDTTSKRIAKQIENTIGFNLSWMTVR